MGNNEQRRTALIAEAQKIQQRLAQIQAELGEMAQAEHAANHAAIWADSIRHQQALLMQVEQRKQESAQRRTEQDAAVRATRLDGAEAQRQAREYTERFFGRRAG